MALPFELWMLWRAANERDRAPVFQGTSSGCGRQVPLVGYTLLETRLGFHTTSGPLHRSHSTHHSTSPLTLLPSTSAGVMIQFKILWTTNTLFGYIIDRLYF